MPGLFDKLGRAAQQTAAESRIRLEIHNLGTRLNDRAQALGLLMFRQHKGETIPEEEYVKLLDELSAIDQQRRAKEGELEELHRPVGMAEAAPAPAGATSPAPAGVTCPGCGAAVAAGTRFCPSCGRALA